MQGKKHVRKKSRKGMFKKKSLYGIVFAIVTFSIAFVYSSLHSSPNQTTNQTFQFKAAIVDHLSLSAPNQTFIHKATKILETAGYTVEYYRGEEVTVEFYKNLPTYNYGLAILRVHSCLVWGEYPPVTLFTSEPYSTSKHSYEQLTGQITRVAFSPYNEGDPTYFGIGPDFVRFGMSGRFDNTLVIMMGCSGLTYTEMAEAFVEKGAKVYISWSESVLSSHTDQATTCLLKHLITEKQTIKQAVTETMKEVGPDPVDGSILGYYPHN